MYPHFIEVHYDGDPYLVNVNQITWFDTGIIQTENRELYCNESYDDLKQLIRDCGCAITKADPRLDMSIPLSMDELCKPMMIGEPVFNSNTRAWMLIADSALDNSSWVDLVDHAGKIVRFGPHDVVKYPLYRMRRE